MRYLTDQKWLLESPELLALDNDLSAESLLELCQVNKGFEFNQTHRLGFYFEQLWHHLVDSSKSLELAHKNLQVIIDKHTYGEFDSIIQLNRQMMHCELAVKFYLQIGNGDKLSDWVGPNLRDRFDNKYKRLMEHQLNLSQKTEIQQWLKQKNIYIDQSKVLAKGRLFYPYTEFIEKKFSFPEEVSSNHLTGFWVTYSQLDKLLQNTNYRWYQLPRFYWLAEVENIDKELLPIETQFEGFSLQKIVALKEGQDGCVKEVMRGFVVNDEWLHKAKQKVLG